MKKKNSVNAMLDQRILTLMALKKLLPKADIKYYASKFFRKFALHENINDFSRTAMTILTPGTCYLANSKHVLRSEYRPIRPGS